MACLQFTGSYENNLANTVIVNLHKGVLQLHRWTGLTVGLVIVMLAVTGAVNLFRPDLEPVVNGDLLTVDACSQRVTLETLTRNARASHPGGELDYIRILAAEEGAPRIPATRIRFSDPQEDVYLNPCTGKVLGERVRYGGFLGRVEQLHILRYAEDKWVRSITAVCAMIFAAVLIAGGLYMWWPRQGGGQAFRLDSRLRGRARSMNRHKIAGLYSSAVLVLLVLTALPLAFEWYRNGLYTLTGSALPAKAPKSAIHAGAMSLSMDAFWAKAQSLLPGPADALLKYRGKKADAPLEGYMIARDAPHPNARSMLFLDAYSGDVLRYVPYPDSSAGHKLYFWTISFHTGLVGGWLVKALLLAAALAVPVMAYTGIGSYLRRRRAIPHTDSRSLSVRVRRIAVEAQDIKSFELVSATDEALAPFTPGAHINVELDDGLARQYSLCNDAAQRDRYLIAVKHVADSRGGSRTMHERVDEGDVLSISAPRNHFPLERSARHQVLLAGGIGITPLLCMAKHLLSTGASFELHYFTRSIEHTAFHGELSRPAFRGKVTFHYAIEPDRLHETLHKLLWHRAEGAHMYLCGPRPFMDLVEKMAAPNWPPESIHVEYFNADPMASAGVRAPFEVVLARSGGIYPIPVSTSIVEVLARNGVAVVTSCEQGVCGTCLTGVLEGTPDHRDAFLSEEERRACTKMLLCVSRAKSDRLVLDL